MRNDRSTGCSSPARGSGQYSFASSDSATSRRIIASSTDSTSARCAKFHEFPCPASDFGCRVTDAALSPGTHVVTFFGTRTSIYARRNMARGNNARLIRLRNKLAEMANLSGHRISSHGLRSSFLNRASEVRVLPAAPASLQIIDQLLAWRRHCRSDESRAQLVVEICGVKLTRSEAGSE